ncbi:sensor histidine kinase [Paenibacillus agaridevorans]|uniref:sensor histidine kinase n=1 Tax=Paenibacillus agaridevorans TaxID=171404 RepID=UPI001BE45C1F|nr:histidine kinase [Paenibacillus agaridevorans]
MKSAFIIWRKSIFTRLIVTFLLIVSPIYLVAFLIYNWGINSVKEELEGTMKSQLSFYSSNLDTEIQRVNSLLFNTLYDSNLTDLANLISKLSDYDTYQSINNLQQRLLVLQNSNIYVSNVTAHIPSADMIVTSNDGRGPLEQEPLHYFNSAKSNSKSQLLLYKGDIYLRALLPLDINYRIEKKVHLLTVKLSIERIRAALGQLETRRDSGAVLLLPDNKMILSDAVDIEFASSLKNVLISRLKEAPSGTIVLENDKRQYFAVYMKSDYLNTALVQYVPMEALTEKAEQFKTLFLFFSLSAVLVIALYMLSAFKFIQQPMLKLIRVLRQMEMGNLNVEITHRRTDEFGFLFQRFNGMMKNLNQLIDQVYKQQILTQQAELRQLQSQINPHFLYNTYFVLYNMAMSEDYDNVKLFTHQLGSYLKYITRNAVEDVPLHIEVDHARTYCDIQSLRFYNRIEVEFGHIPPSFRDKLVPRLILQPVIENAFEHGISDMKSGGWLVVRFEKENDGFVIIVEDNGPSISEARVHELNRLLTPGRDDVSEITAIVNIHRRLRLKFGEESGLSFEVGDKGGLRVNIFVREQGAN